MTTHRGLARRRLNRMHSAAPVLGEHTDIPRPGDCCTHCRTEWAPADCPLINHTPCAECSGNAA